MKPEDFGFKTWKEAVLANWDLLEEKDKKKLISIGIGGQ